MPTGPVEQYYQEHFSELTPEKQFHFATRLKNYLHRDYQDFLAKHQPAVNLAETLSRQAPSTLTHYQERQPFLQKYQKLYGLEAALFEVLHQLQEYNNDLRPELTKLISEQELYNLSDQLLSDPEATFVLSSYAVNTICLIELLFPRNLDVFTKLAELTPPLAVPPILVVYYYTHIIICDTGFYTRPINPARITLYHQLLTTLSQFIQTNFATTSLDIKLEYLVCCNLTQFIPTLKQSIAVECHAILQNSPYLIDSTRPAHLNTLNGAEHRNVLYIMSGLDS